jgi:hypothetical protein
MEKRKENVKIYEKIEHFSPLVFYRSVALKIVASEVIAQPWYLWLYSNPRLVDVMDFHARTHFMASTG